MGRRGGPSNKRETRGLKLPKGGAVDSGIAGGTWKEVPGVRGTGNIREKSTNIGGRTLEEKK